LHSLSVTAVLLVNCLVYSDVYYTCIVQLLEVGYGCPKYSEVRKEVYDSDWVKKMEQHNKVSPFSSALTQKAGGVGKITILDEYLAIASMTASASEAKALDTL